jgi:hypothetical protein
MFHFSAVPFACLYQADLSCPLGEVLRVRGEAELVTEALPCAWCAHHFTALAPSAERPLRLGKTEVAILIAACHQPLRFYPLTRRMTVEGQERHNTRVRFYRATRRLAACGAVRVIGLPTQQPGTERIVLRETTWLQVTVLGRVFNSLPPANNSYARVLRRVALRECLAAARATLNAEPQTLLTEYIENLAYVLQRVLDHVLLATSPVIQAHLVHEHARYARADLHLERVSAPAHAVVTQHFLKVQEDLRQMAARELTVRRKPSDLLQ